MVFFSLHNRLSDHAQDKSKLPILIFPEGQFDSVLLVWVSLKHKNVEHEIRSLFFLLAGTCINNTSVMMFKKGSFEIGGTVYPVAIKVGEMSLSCVLTVITTTCWQCHLNIYILCSMIPDLEMPSGIAANLEWSITCYVWWAAGPLSAVCGTFLLCPERYNSDFNCTIKSNMHAYVNQYFP